jgi:hypothetical protein
VRTEEARSSGEKNSHEMLLNLLSGRQPRMR